MPTYSTILVSIVLVLFWSCDVEQGPLTNANDMFERGTGLFDENSYDQAEVLFAQAISAFEEEGDYSRVADSYSYLSRISLARGQFKSGLEQALTAFENSKTANDFRGQARHHLLLGDIHQAMREYAVALKHYDSSLSLSSAFDDKVSKAAAQMKKASALYWMSRWDEALAHYDEALTYFRSVNDDHGIVAALVGIGKTYSLQHRYGEALNSLTQAQRLLDSSDDPTLDSQLHLSLGNVYRAMNDGNSALRYFRDGANSLRARRTGKEYETLLLFQIATIYNESRRFDDARKFYDEALSAAKESGDRIAESYLYLFLALATEQQIPSANPDFQLESRTQSLMQIAQRFRDCGHTSGEAYTFVQIGNLYQRTGRLAEAREMYQRAIELDEERLAEFIDPELHLPYKIELQIDRDHDDWYRRLAAVLVQLRRSEDAMSYLDRARSREYALLLSDVDVGIRNVGLQKEMDEIKSARNQCRLLQLEISRLTAYRQSQPAPQVLNQFRIQTARLHEEIRERAARISASYPNYGPLTGTSAAVRLNDLQGNIPSGTVVVTYLSTQDYLYIFALSKGTFQVKTVTVGRDRLLSQIDEYKRLLKDPNVYAGAAGEASLPAMTRFANLSTQLYDLLIRPIEPLLDRSLVIVAGQDFEGFPFQTIEREDRNTSVKYLIELTSVDYVSTLSSMKFRTSNAMRIRNIAAIGNPTGKNWSIDYELRDIRSFFKGASVLIGFEATWNNLKSSREDVLQISSNFRNVPGNFPLGTIAFSDGQTLEESMEIPFENLTSLQAIPVVVLSNTFGQGNGLTPLHAFLLRIHGTSDVFFNAWAADRKAAKFFSEFFYTHLSNGLAPGDAYRQALLNLIRTKDVNHPFSWGQFFHYGIG